MPLVPTNFAFSESDRPTSLCNPARFFGFSSVCGRTRDRGIGRLVSRSRDFLFPADRRRRILSITLLHAAPSFPRTTREDILSWLRMPILQQWRFVVPLMAGEHEPNSYFFFLRLHRSCKIACIPPWWSNPDVTFKKLPRDCRTNADYFIEQKRWNVMRIFAQFPSSSALLASSGSTSRSLPPITTASVRKNVFPSLEFLNQ